MLAVVDFILYFGTVVGIIMLNVSSIALIDGASGDSEHLFGVAHDMLLGSIALLLLVSLVKFMVK